MVLFFFALVGNPVSAHAQGVHPVVQSMIDDLNSWMNKEVQEKGSVDPLVLQQKSERIRAAQDSLAKVEAAALKDIKSTSGEVLETKKFTRTLMAGSSLVVPANCEWRVSGMYVKGDMDSYRIKVSSIPLKEVYVSGDKITAPTMASEAALLSGDSMSASYDLDIIEVRFK
jgi:hypothetical protein